jgi:CspA family cold shock protein
VQYAVAVAGRPEVGTVKFFNRERKFGFIQPEDEGKAPVFLAGVVVRASGLAVLYTGQRVEYVRQRDRHGRNDVAGHIRLLPQEA